MDNPEEMDKFLNQEQIENMNRPIIRTEIERII